MRALIDGICEMIYSHFGDVMEIYTENVEQGFVEPCFYVAMIEPRKTNFFDKRYFRANKFAVHYFPGEKHGLDVFETLFEILEYIECDGQLFRGSNMSGEISDGVYIFIVNYDYFSNEYVEGNKMEEVLFNGRSGKSE